MKKFALLLLLGFMLVWCDGITKNWSSSVSTNTTTQETEDTSGKKVPLVTGKKKLIALMSTTCPHCNNEIPVLDKFYRAYKDDVTMQVIVVNADSNGKSKFAGNYQIPQETDPEKIKKLTYQALTGEACGYVPSFVIFSPDNQIEEKICGGSLTYEALEEKLLFEVNPRDPYDIDYDSIQVPQDTAFQEQGFQKDDLWVVMTTNHGKIEIRMFPRFAPKTVDNFLALAAKGYYDGLTFHRVIQNFMIQWGDPNGNGTGGESIYGEKFEDEFSPRLTNIPGSLAMANSGPATNGSQFFINQVNNDFLNNKHSVFGQVVNGMEVVEEILTQETNTSDAPITPVVMEKVEVVQYDGKTLKPYTFTLWDSQKIHDNNTIQEWDLVYVHYKLHTTDDETIIDSSYSRYEPIAVIINSQTPATIPGFMKALKELKLGDKTTVTIPAKDGYWEEGKTMEVPRKELEDAMAQGWDTTEIKKWAVIFDTEILDVTDTHITILDNHPLLWKDLVFELEIMKIN